MILLSDIQQAQQQISSWVERTPLIRSAKLSQLFNTNIYLKLEIFQKTGAFKIRGAFNKILSLNPEEKQRGIIAVSAGNHGRAVACAAQALKIPARIFMPAHTSLISIEAIQAYDAEVILTPSLKDAFIQAKQQQCFDGCVFVHPFEDPYVIAGQGTIGLEICADLPQVTDVMVSIGGGGLISGIATAIKNISPSCRIWGVETEGAPTMARALEAGKVVHLDHLDTIAKTLAAPAVGEINLAIAQKYLEKIQLVSDEQTFKALLFLLEQIKVLTEPAAACNLAALEVLRDQFKPESHVVLVLCGANISLDEIETLKQKFDF